MEPPHALLQACPHLPPPPQHCLPLSEPGVTQTASQKPSLEDPEGVLQLGKRKSSVPSLERRPFALIATLLYLAGLFQSCSPGPQLPAVQAALWHPRLQAAPSLC